MAEMAPFSGSSRVRLVDELARTFRAVEAAQRPRLVCIEGSLGVGKTRIIQELYARLAADQGYWPASLTSEDGVGPLRFQVAPTPERADWAAPMPWMWWGVGCALHRGQPMPVLAHELGQLRCHEAGLVALAERDQALRRALKSLATLGVGFVPVGGGLLNAGTIAEGAQAIYEAAEAIRAQQNTRRRPSISGLAMSGDSYRDLTGEVIGLLRLLGRHGVSLVFALDDAHYAEPSVVSLLDVIFRTRLRIGIFCVCTSAAGATVTSAGGTFSEWLRKAETLADGAVVRIEVERLESDALDRFIAWHAPKTAPETRRALVGCADGNPLVLEGMLTSSQARRSLADGALVLTPTDVVQLPNTYADHFAARWSELPSTMREVLVLAAVQGRVFLPELIEHTLTVLGRHAVAGTTVQLLNEGVQSGWLVRTHGRYAFAELAGFEAAMRGLYGEELVTGDAMVRLRSELCDRIAAMKADAGAWAELPDAVRLLALEVEVRLSSAQEAEVNRESAVESAILLGRVQASSGSAGLALETHALGATLASGLPPGHVLDVLAREELAATLGILDRHDEALDLMRDALRVREDTLGSDHRLTIGARVNVAIALMSVRRYAEALHHLRDVLHALEEQDGVDGLQTLLVREWLATALARLRSDEALPQQLRVVADSERHFGEHAYATLNARTNLAWVMELEDRQEEALELMTELVELCERALGSDDLMTLYCRYERADLLESLYRFEEAHQIWSAVTRARERLLGQDHHSTVHCYRAVARILGRMHRDDEAKVWGERAADAYARALAWSSDRSQQERLDRLDLLESLAWALSHAGRHDEAVEQSLHFFEESRALLGSDHLEILSAHHLLTAACMNAARYPEAVEHGRAFVHACERLDVDGQPARVARWELVSALFAVGDNGAALAEAEAMYADRQRTLGRGHLDTLAACHQVAAALHKLERYTEALQRSRPLVGDCERVLGVDHVETLRTREVLAATLGALDRRGEALAQWRLVVSGLERVFGTDHPETMRIRPELAKALDEAELHEEVLLQWQALLTWEQGDHGGVPRRIGINKAQYGLAVSYLSLGRFDDALPYLTEVLAFREAELGREHSATLEARFHVAATLSELDRDAEALPHWRDVIADCAGAPEHYGEVIVESRQRLALSLEVCDDAEGALEQWREALAAAERFFGADHEEAIFVRQGLALALDRLGTLEAGLREWEVVLERATAVLGDHHETTLEARREVAESKAALGHHAEAVEAWRDLARDLARLRGPDADETLAARQALARALADARDDGESVQVYRALIGDHERVHGAQDEGPLGVRWELARTLTAQRRVDEALEEWRTLAADTEALGPDRLDTHRVNAELAQALAAVGRHEDALRLWPGVVAGLEHLLGPLELETLGRRFEFARALSDSGHDEDAVRHLRVVLAGLERAEGDNRESIGIVREELDRAEGRG